MPMFEFVLAFLVVLAIGVLTTAYIGYRIVKWFLVKMAKTVYAEVKNVSTTDDIPLR